LDRDRRRSSIRAVQPILVAKLLLGMAAPVASCLSSTVPAVKDTNGF